MCSKKYWNKLFGETFNKTEQLSIDNIIYLIIEMYHNECVNLRDLLYGSKSIAKAYEDLNITPIYFG